MNFWITGPLSSRGGPLATFGKAFEKELLSLKVCGDKISLNNVAYIKMGLTQLEGPELGSQVLVPPPPERNVPLIPMA